MTTFSQVTHIIIQLLDDSTSNDSIIRRIKEQFSLDPLSDRHPSPSSSTSLLSIEHDDTRNSDCNSSDGTNGDDGGTRTFLDTCADDELRRIAGLVGVNLRHIFLYNHAFRRVTPALFHTLEMHDSRRLKLRPTKGIIELGRCDETKEILLALIACGRYIRTIILRSSSPLQLFNTEIGVYAKVLAHLCPNVDRIICKGDDDDEMSKHTLDELVRAFRKRLVYLEIIGRNRFYDGAFGALALSRLSQGGVLPQLLPLRSFTYAGDISKGHLAPLWRTMQQLEEVNLSLSANTNWAPTFDSLRTHCRKLHSVILDNPLRTSAENLVTEEDFANLLCSYGPQLRKALVHSISADNSARLAAACPNVRCIFIEKRNHFNRISALGPHIESLSVRVKTDSERDEDWGQLANAIASCKTLTSLKINTKPFTTGMVYPVAGSCIRRIFEAPLVHLEHLSLSVLGSYIPAEHIACATGRLKTAKIHFWHFSIPGFWNEMMKHNARLEVVDILDRESRKMECTARYIDNLVDNVLLRLRHIKKILYHGQYSQHPGTSFCRKIALKLSHRQIAFGFRFKDSKHYLGQGIDR